MQSRYNPATASATLTHTRIPARFFRKIPNTGTITMYSAVMNPAFPTVVY